MQKEQEKKKEDTPVDESAFAPCIQVQSAHIHAWSPLSFGLQNARIGYPGLALALALDGMD